MFSVTRLGKLPAWRGRFSPDSSAWGRLFAIISVAIYTRQLFSLPGADLGEGYRMLGPAAFG